MNSILKITSLLTCSLSFICVLAKAQNRNLPKSIRLVPYRSGFKVYNMEDTSSIPIDTTYYIPSTYGPKYRSDTLSTNAILNKKLKTVSARFYQIRDTILASMDSDISWEYFSGSLKNAFSEKNNLQIRYFIRSNKYSGRQFKRIVDKTIKLLYAVSPNDTILRDSIIDNEYKRYINYRIPQNVLYNGDSCFSEADAVIHTDYDKNILNADSVTIVQYISPPKINYIRKDVVIYKKGLGYVDLEYGLHRNANPGPSYQEASDLLDAAIRQTWGIIRFNKD